MVIFQASGLILSLNSVIYGVKKSNVHLQLAAGREVLGALKDEDGSWGGAAAGARSCHVPLARGRHRRCEHTREEKQQRGRALRCY